MSTREILGMVCVFLMALVVIFVIILRNRKREQERWESFFKNAEHDTEESPNNQSPNARIEPPPSATASKSRNEQNTIATTPDEGVVDLTKTEAGVPKLEFMAMMNEDNRPAEQKRWGLNLRVNQGAHTGNTVPQGSGGGPLVVANPDIRSHLETELERWKRLEVRQAQADRLEWYILTLRWLDYRTGGHTTDLVLLPIGPHLETLKKYREKSQKLLPNLSRGGLHEPPFTLEATRLIALNEDGYSDDPQVRELARQQMAALQFPMARAKFPSCDEQLLESLLPPGERISTLVN